MKPIDEDGLAEEPQVALQVLRVQLKSMRQFQWVMFPILILIAIMGFGLNLSRVWVAEARMIPLRENLTQCEREKSIIMGMRNDRNETHHRSD